MKQTHQMRAFSSMLALVTLMLFVGSSSATELRSWSNKIENHKRFKVLKQFDGAAVLDRETQLVWEQSPGTAAFTWSEARLHCAKKQVGGRMGWRLPSFYELASLVDHSKASPSLPYHHPFNVSTATRYWTTTQDINGGTGAVTVNFVNGEVSTLPEFLGGTTNLVWCVRGGSAGANLH